MVEELLELLVGVVDAKLLKGIDLERQLGTDQASLPEGAEPEAPWNLPRPYLENLKAGNVQDAQEGGALPFGLVQGFVHPGEDPAEEPLIGCFGQGLYCKVSLRRQGEPG